MSSYERQPRIPAWTNCPTCRSHAAVFRAQLAGSRFYCARCRRTFRAACRQSYSTAFSLGPAARGGALADTIALVPDTKVEIELRVEPTGEDFPSIRLPSFAQRRRASSRAFWRHLGFGVALGLGLVAVVVTMASVTRGGSAAERPAAAELLLR
ncbi:MAG TPA: hypothetical protein VG826_15845 [Pirellulales bacterium]|nr:hypothetical protein [Pirellulales bacterium]